jgi:hypothetical protein
VENSILHILNYEQCQYEVTLLKSKNTVFLWARKKDLGMQDTGISWKQCVKILKLGTTIPDTPASNLLTVENQVIMQRPTLHRICPASKKFL